MAIVYTADEIFNIGVEIEKNGRTFYEAASRAASGASVKAFFDRLAKWEIEHEKLFAALQSGLSGQAKEPVSYDPAGELGMYLKAAADTHIFKVDADIPSLVKQCKTEKEALAMALTFEKDSVVLYSTMLNLVPEHLGKKDVQKILSEELKHVSIITEEMGKMGTK
jgi:rubrerythrin